MKLEQQLELADLWQDAVAATHTGCTTSLCNAYSWCVEVQGVIHDAAECSPKELLRRVAVWRGVSQG